MAPNIVEKIADVLHEDKAAATSGGGTKKPIFEKEKVTVIFVLGGPGAGMSSLCPTPATQSTFNPGSSSVTLYLI